MYTFIQYVLACEPSVEAHLAATTLVLYGEWILMVTLSLQGSTWLTHWKLNRTIWKCLNIFSSHFRVVPIVPFLMMRLRNSGNVLKSLIGKRICRIIRFDSYEQGGSFISAERNVQNHTSLMPQWLILREQLIQSPNTREAIAMVLFRIRILLKILLKQLFDWEQSW